MLESELEEDRLRAISTHIRWIAHPAAVLAGSWIELGTECKSLLQMLDENPHFGGQPAAGGPHGEDWHRSLKGRKKTGHDTFSEFCGEEPCWCLGYTQMFEDTHPHLFQIAGSKDSCWDNAFHTLRGAKTPRLH